MQKDLKVLRGLMESKVVLVLKDQLVLKDLKVHKVQPENKG